MNGEGDQHAVIGSGLFHASVIHDCCELPFGAPFGFAVKLRREAEVEDDSVMGWVGVQKGHMWLVLLILLLGFVAYSASHLVVCWVCI